MIGPLFTDDRGEILDNPPPIMATLFWPLIAAKGASILANFSRPRSGVKYGSGNNPSLAAIRCQKEGRVKPKWLARGRREFLGNRGKPTTNPADPLSGP